jgi:hypothetical protein
MAPPSERSMGQPVRAAPSVRASTDAVRMGAAERCMWLVAETAGTAIALPVTLISAICHVRDLTPLPQSHRSVCGATNHHGTPLIVLAPFPVLQDGVELPKQWMPACAIVLNQQALRIDAEASVLYGIGMDRWVDTHAAEPVTADDDLVIAHAGRHIRAYDHRQLHSRLAPLFIN